MPPEPDAAVFGRYVDRLLDHLQPGQFDRAALRQQILSVLLEGRKKTNPQARDPPLSESAIRTKAEEIAAWDNPYDTLIWLWAESSLELKTGAKPAAETTVGIAQHYAAVEKDLAKVHWYLAENLLRLERRRKTRSDGPSG